MKSNYKQTFDAVCMSPESHERIRSELSARISENQKEDNIVSIKSRSTKKLLVAVAAAIIILALSTIVAFAYGDQIVQLLGGGQIVTERTGNGYSTSISITSENPDPIEIRDGRVFFILNGSETDITDYCTESTYFHHEETTEKGYRHVFIVGGTPDLLGWAEFIWDDTGLMIGSSMVYQPDDNDALPKWLELATERFQS